MTLYSLLVVSSSLEDFGWKLFGGVLLAAIVGGFAYIKKGLRRDWEKDQQKATEQLRELIETKLNEYAKGRKDRDEQFFALHRRQDEKLQEISKEQNERIQLIYRETEARFARIETTQEHDKRDIREIAGSLKTLEKKLDDTKDEVIRAIMDVRVGK